MVWVNCHVLNEGSSIFPRDLCPILHICISEYFYLQLKTSEVPEVRNNHLNRLQPLQNIFGTV